VGDNYRLARASVTAHTKSCYQALQQEILHAPNPKNAYGKLMIKSVLNIEQLRPG
jgi:hypothetical protein